MNDTPPTDQRRRSFLKLCSLLGAGAVTGALLPSQRAEALLFGKREYKVSDTRLLMGSFFSITVIHNSRDEAQNAIGLANAEIDRLGKIFSRFDADTPVAQLNKVGTLDSAPPELMAVINRSLYFHRLTNGAFDITVQPVVDLFKTSFATGHKPTDAEITALLPRIGSEHIRIADRTISFQRDNMGITLDGIAPGYMVDRASALLTRLGVTNHMINCSGDIRTSGATIKGAPWSIAIQDPNHQGAYPDVVSMGTGAITTSGNYEIYYDQEKMFHHIVNPHTGYSPQLTTSVTTTDASLIDADALATGLMVLSPEESISLIAKHPRYQCFIVGRDAKTTHSSGWSNSLA